MAEEIQPPERPRPASGSGAGESRAAAHSGSLLVRWMAITDANSAGFVHGGTVMRLVDEVAGLAAIKHSGRRVVTAGMDRMTFLTTGAGRPYSPAYFGNVFRKWCDQAGLPPECRAHGIRKAVATRIADAGHGAHAIAAVTGHRRLQDVAHYTRAADQMRLASGTRSALAGTKEEPIDGKPEAILGKLRRNTLKRKG